MRASTSSGSALDAGRPCDAVEPHKQHQLRYEEAEMQELLASIDAFHAQLNVTMAHGNCAAAETCGIKLQRHQQPNLFDCAHDARPKLLQLRPKSDDNTNLSCWQLERRRQATYRVLFGRPLPPPTLSPATSPHTIASPLVQQTTKASKAASFLTAKPSRKCKLPKPKARPTKTLKRLCTTQSNQIAVEEELYAVKEEKLSLIDQILFGDDSHEFALEDNEADFTDAERRSLDSDVKSQLDDNEDVNGLSLANTELLLEELESDRVGSEQLSSILSLDFLKSLEEDDEERLQEAQGDQEATPRESSSPLDSSLLDDLLGASGGCGDGGSLEFAL